MQGEENFNEYKALIQEGNREEFGYLTRGMDNDIHNFFEENRTPRNLPNGENNNINRIIETETRIDPVKLMNNLTNAIEEKLKDISLIDTAENLKIEILLEDDTEEENGNCKMSLELFRCGEGRYLLKLLREEGQNPHFNEYFLKIKTIIENIF